MKIEIFMRNAMHNVVFEQIVTVFHDLQVELLRKY